MGHRWLIFAADALIKRADAHLNWVSQLPVTEGISDVGSDSPSRQRAVAVDVFRHPLQFIWVGMSLYGMFIIFIPIYVLLFLPARMVLVGDTRGFLHSASVMLWGMVTTVFALSHVAFLMMLPGVDT